MSYVKDKSKEQILDEMYSTAQPGTIVHEQQKAAILVRCTQDLEKAFRDASNSANSLSEKIFFLNIILVIATIIGAVATAAIAYRSFFP